MGHVLPQQEAIRQSVIVCEFVNVGNIVSVSRLVNVRRRAVKPQPAFRVILFQLNILFQSKGLTWIDFSFLLFRLDLSWILSVKVVLHTNQMF